MLRFEPGVEEEEIEIEICDDDSPEDDEIFYVDLLHPRLVHAAVNVDEGSAPNK